MRSIVASFSLVTCSFLAFATGCGGSGITPSGSAPAEEPAPQLQGIANACTLGHDVEAEIADVTHVRDVSARPGQLAWIDAPSAFAPGSVHIATEDGAVKVADDVDHLTASSSMFAWTFHGGGLGTFQRSVSLRPSVTPQALAADGDDVAWIEGHARGFALRRTSIDGRIRELANGTLLAAVGAGAGATWYATREAGVTTLHRVDYDDRAVAVLDGSPKKILTQHDHAIVQTDVGVLDVGSAPSWLWNDPVADVAADQELVFLATKDTGVVELRDGVATIVYSACQARAIATDGARIHVLVSDGRAGWILGLPRGSVQPAGAPGSQQNGGTGPHRSM